MYAALAQLDDENRKRDRGAFFGSIHRTLNHLVWADSIWISRFTSGSYAKRAYGTDLFDDFDALAREREATDHAISAWAGQLCDEWLGSTLTYRAASDGRDREMPAWIAAAHMFNHATHHRGQLTTLMKQADVDPGVTDLPFMPGVMQAVD